MEGNLFAFELIIILACSCVLAIIKGTKPSRKSMLFGILVAIAIFLLLVLLFPSHLCRRGESIGPAIIGAISAGIITAAIQEKKIRILCWLLIIMWSFLMNIWGMKLVHHGDYVGNRKWPDFIAHISAIDYKCVTNAMQSSLKEMPNDKYVKEGWIEDVWNDAAAQEIFSDPPKCPKVELRHFWHTFFTGIWKEDVTLRGIWCSGGYATNCINMLSFRERNETNIQKNTTADGTE